MSTAYDVWCWPCRTWAHLGPHRPRRPIAWFPVQLWAFTRLAYFAMSEMGMRAIPVTIYHPEANQELAQWPWLDGLNRWDVGWFKRIAIEGYAVAENAKVFPLMPMLAWAGGKLGSPSLTLIIASNVAALASFVLLYRLFAKLQDEAAAKCALTLFAACPWAFYQAAGYAESTMIALTALSLAWALEGKHIRAGLALGLGVMARHVAIFYGAGLLVAQWRQKRLRTSDILGLVVPWLFVGAFALHLHAMNGDPLAFWNARTIGWGEMVWWSVRDVMANTPYAERPELYWMATSGLLVWVGAAMLAKERRWELLACAIPSLLVFYSSGAATGLGRYTASVWPAFLPLGVWLAKRPSLQAPTYVALAMTQGVLFFLFSHQWRVI